MQYPSFLEWDALVNFPILVLDRVGHVEGSFGLNDLNGLSDFSLIHFI